MNSSLRYFSKNLNYFDDLKELKKNIKNMPSSKVIVYTYGAWDLVHPGHIRFLSRAKELGDFLIVGIISDKQIKEFKGIDRPIQSENDRLINIGSLRMVDAVIRQPIYDPSAQLNQISKIDILTKGDDWDYIPGEETIQSLGGKLIKLGYTDNFSTSAIVKKMSKQ
tara:strand:- start:1186 stop:1683 length:498 start_codon:yes stop_codon:yes gene_type:complete